MARTICIANQKGGVGKTTTSVNLSSALARRSRRVLLLDLDPQGNASSGIGLKRYQNQNSNIYHVLIGEQSLDDATRECSEKNLHIVPANSDLVGAEIELVDMPEREFRLKSAIATIGHKYDYVIIDCPPSLGLLTVNALSAADSFLVPLQCEYFALEGLSQLLNTAGIIKKNLNTNLKIEGIVLTMFDKRNNLSHQVVTEIRTHFADKVFDAIIPRNVRLSEAPSHGKSIFSYDNKSIGAKRYAELAAELDIRVYGKISELVESEPEENSQSESEVPDELDEELSSAAAPDEDVAPLTNEDIAETLDSICPSQEVNSYNHSEKENQIDSVGADADVSQESEACSSVVPIRGGIKPYLRAVEAKEDMAGDDTQEPEKKVVQAVESPTNDESPSSNDPEDFSLAGTSSVVFSSEDESQWQINSLAGLQEKESSIGDEMNRTVDLESGAWSPGDDHV